MRAQQRKRPRKREVYVPFGTDLKSLASRAEYVGSVEHKDYPSFAGQPRPRRDASLCPRWIKDQDMVRGWLRSAISQGAVGAPWEGEFPRYVWYKHDSTVFEGRLTERRQGAYKGYPIDEAEWPRGIEELYA